MREIFNKFYQNHSLIYKVLLFISTTVLIVYLFPKGGSFKYSFQKGKPWQYENLYAPFDFAIQKSDEELKSEAEEIEKNQQLYFVYREDVQAKVIENYKKKINLILQENKDKKLNINNITNFGLGFLNRIYKVGFLNKSDNDKIKNAQLITLRKGNEAQDVLSEDLITTDKLVDEIHNYFRKSEYRDLENSYTSLFFEIIEPNVFYDEELTDRVLDEELGSRSATKGLVAEKERIILKGDLVDNQKYEILQSLKNEYDNQLWSRSNYYWVVLGYTVLVSLSLMMIFLFLKKYRLEIFHNNTKLAFILFNIALFVLLVTVVQNYWVSYIYVVPIIILPIVLKAFFDPRLGLFVHVNTVLLLGFIVPNSFEFIFLQIIAGMVTILTVSELHRRFNLFVSILKITAIYIISYIAFYLIQNGSNEGMKYAYFGMFALNGVLSFLSLFLILLYEKTFGLVSDVSLLELSDTNSPLLRELNEKAPGTFQHSIQVANLAEASANEVGANALLVRAGALYHDIGKMLNPIYFVENQTTNVNPHHDLSPIDSVKIIRAHVLNGIEIGKRNRLPDRIIDFIRTHHGTNLIYYFYRAQGELTPEEVKEEDFRYTGPIPFSKETAILMMCDSCEAASKSIKQPTAILIDELVEKVITTQINSGQFLNADITFKEVLAIKKVIKKKLHNIYHLRIEYPE